MQTRKLGRTGLEVPNIGLGAMFIGGPEGDAPSQMDEDLAAATVVAGIEAGSTFVDTAPGYGRLTSEHVIGRVLRERPDLAKITTVVTKTGSPPGDKDYSYDGVLRQVEESLERLGLDTIDLISIHDAMGQPMEDVLSGALRALRTLQDQGVVRHIGTAMNDPSTNEPYVETGEFDVAVVPNAWTLINRIAENRIFPAAKKHNTGVLLATPFERGLLAKGAKSNAYFHRRNFSAECLAHVAEIETLCEQYDIPLHAVALHYVLRHPQVSIVIPGARTPEEATGNAKASEVEIPEALWNELEPQLRDWNATEHRQVGF